MTELGVELKEKVFESLFSMHPPTPLPPFLDGIPFGQEFYAMPSFCVWNKVITIPFPWPVSNPGDGARSQHSSNSTGSYSATSQPPDALGGSQS